MWYSTSNNISYSETLNFTTYIERRPHDLRSEEFLHPEYSNGIGLQDNLISPLYSLGLFSVFIHGSVIISRHESLEEKVEIQEVQFVANTEGPFIRRCQYMFALSMSTIVPNRRTKRLDTRRLSRTNARPSFETHLPENHTATPEGEMQHEYGLSLSCPCSIAAGLPTWLKSLRLTDVHGHLRRQERFTLFNLGSQ